MVSGRRRRIQAAIAWEEIGDETTRWILAGIPRDASLDNEDCSDSSRRIVRGFFVHGNNLSEVAVKRIIAITPNTMTGTFIPFVSQDVAQESADRVWERIVRRCAQVGFPVRW